MCVNASITTTTTFTTTSITTYSITVLLGVLVLTEGCNSIFFLACFITTKLLVKATESFVINYFLYYIVPDIIIQYLNNCQPVLTLKPTVSKLALRSGETLNNDRMESWSYC